ncbi:SET domain-containing 5 protein [Rutstroemia sp. NJR-2017a BBW]|nr:SET domain-containing 5 protein [Rutstroemia sp. NJR-2017a BBW]
MAPSKDSPATAVANGHTSEDTPLWTIKRIPGKGLGVVATRAIAPGTLLFHESPLLTTETLTNPATTEKDLAQLLRALPKESQRAYLSLHNNYPGQPSPLSNIIRSNAYPLGPSSSVGGVFKDISRINHSCLPTSQHSWNESRKEFVVYAVRELSPGDEITTSYHVGGPSTAKLDQVIGDAERVMKHPEKALKDCRDLEIIYREEGIQDQRVGRVYWDAFQICNRHGDLARASEFAKKYRERKILGEGEDSKDAIEALAFIKDPKKHESCGGSQKWKSKVSDVPKGKNDDEIEKWLWRED